MDDIEPEDESDASCPVELREVLRRVLLPIVESDRPRLEAESLLVALKLGDRLGLNVSNLAAKHGVSRQAMNTKVVRHRRWIGQPGVKGPKASTTYAQTNFRHPKGQPRQLTTA